MEVLKEMRIKHGYNQQKLADALNVARSTIAMWETGKAEPNHDFLLKISEIFSVSVDYLLGRDEVTSSLDQQMDEIEFALFGEVHDLSDEEKQDVLDYARFKKQQKTISKLRPRSTPVTIAAESGEKLEGIAAPDEADELSAFKEYENN